MKDLQWQEIFGAEKSADSAKYLLFLDSDDLLENTYLECAYWTLETNKDAAWAYSDSIGFDADNYTWNKWFDSEKMKKENELVSAAMVRKTDYKKVRRIWIKRKISKWRLEFLAKTYGYRKIPSTYELLWTVV